jgi:hypothetical protein
MRTFIFLVLAAASVGFADPAQAQVAVTTQNQAGVADDWRYTWHNNQWWYYTPQQQWLYHDGSNWNAHNPAVVSSGSGATYFRGTQYAQPYQSGYRGSIPYGNGYGLMNGAYYGGYGNGQSYQSYGYGTPYNDGYRSYYGNPYGGSYGSGYGGGYGSGLGGSVIGRALQWAR